MIEYKEIDSTGSIIDTHALPEGTAVPENYVKGWGGATSFIVPKWDRKQGKWVEGADAVEALKVVKGSKEAELRDACKDEILQGFTAVVDGEEYYFSYSLENQVNLQDSFNLLSHGTVETVGVNGYLDGKKVRLKLGVEALTAVYLAGVKHKQDTLAYFNDTITDALEEAVTLEEVKAVTWKVQAEKPSLNLPDQALINGVWNDSVKPDKKDNQETAENTL